MSASFRPHRPSSKRPIESITPPRKKPIAKAIVPQVTVRDPITLQSAKGLTRGGAIAKLENKIGKRVGNPIVRRTPG